MGPGGAQNAVTSSVSPELLQGFARGLARVAFLRNITLLAINMKATWQASFLKSCTQANQCNNSGETEEVKNVDVFSCVKYLKSRVPSVQVL